jgi:hypothetical protein
MAQGRIEADSFKNIRLRRGLATIDISECGGSERVCIFAECSDGRIRGYCC